MSHVADVLLVTATDVESRAVLAVFRVATGREAIPEPIDDRLYLDLGEINGARVFMALTGIGTGGLSGSQLNVGKAIEALSPWAVVDVGIAFGVNEDKQAIGDVLVSEQLKLYDLQRIGTDKDGQDQIIPRGDKPHASEALVNPLRVANLRWDPPHPEVRFGVILSGDKLVDSIDFRAQLLTLEAEAIGGEMEGAGAYVACHDRKVDWVVVKAICDWADGKKSTDKAGRQGLAAHNAAAFVLHALEQSTFKRNLEPTRRFFGLRTSRHSAPEPRDPVHSSLPSQPFFFGRQTELDTIAEAVSAEARTWGALIDGPGGIGKTALAIRAAHLVPAGHFERKIYLSAKVRELSPTGEQELKDSILPTYMALITELARELGDEQIANVIPAERPASVRRALAGVRALIVIDNVETIPEPERVTLYQFLSRLPARCKAIVTSRRRTDVDARVVRLDRLERKDALDLMTELAKGNRHLAKATDKERGDLYEVTNGNPLLIRWTVGQLGRKGSQCRTIAEACDYLLAAPKGNDPLEFIFGDLLDTFTDSENAVLAALVHFAEPAKPPWIAAVAGIAEPSARSALEDLSDRALLESDGEGSTFILAPLAATFLRRARPGAIVETGVRLTDRAVALAIENGRANYESFPILEAEWATVSAALPRISQGENDRLQTMCYLLGIFLDFSGRWDDQLALSLRAEEKAVAAGDLLSAGERAYDAALLYYRRSQLREGRACAARCADHWDASPRVGAIQRALGIRLRGIGEETEKNHLAAMEAYRGSLDLFRAAAPEEPAVGDLLADVADMERELGDYVAAERDYRDALQIARNFDDVLGIAHRTYSIARLALVREDWVDATTRAQEALGLAEALGRQKLIALSCTCLAMALARQGTPELGVPHAFRAVRINTELRAPADLEEAEAALRECGR